MKISKYFSAFILAISIFGQTAFAQNTGLPKLKKGEGYEKVRAKMLKAGWKPFKAKDADICLKGDSRCEGRPEMQSCSGTGLGFCRFVWKRKAKTVVIFTVGEEGGSYHGFAFEKNIE